MGPVTTSQHRSTDRRIRCRPVRVAYEYKTYFPQSPANATKVTTTIGTLDYTPLSTRCKFNLFLEQTHSPYTFVSAGPGDLGPGNGPVASLWRRYAGLGEAIWRDSGGYRIAQIHPDVCSIDDLASGPPLFSVAQANVHARIWYSTTRVVVTKNDNGDSTFNTSEFLGALASSALQNAYYPRHDRTFGDTMNRFGGALSSDAMGDLLREFAPDIKCLFRKHAPKTILKIEENLPIPAEDKP